ncbi:MAG: hypothetical protein V3U43_06025 [Pseudomonadales bacterium]
MFTMFWNLCLLRTGPERMPTAPAFIATVLAMNIALNIGALPLMNRLSATAVGAIVATTAAIAAVTFAILSVKGLQARFAATFIAIVGSDIIITIAQLALSPMVILLGGEDMLEILFFASLLWALIVIGFIFQRALEVRYGVGFALGILLILIVALISTQVDPPPPAA